MPHSVEENNGNGRPDWQTPPDTAAHIRRRFGITYDAFASHENAKAERYSTISGTFVKVEVTADPANNDQIVRGRRQISEEDGLTHPWTGERVFFNPPYSHGWGDLLATKIAAERNRAALMVGLLMADTSTLFWREFVIPNAEAITYLPRVQYVLDDEALVAWRAAGVEREQIKALDAGKFLDAEEVRAKWETKTPGSPNFGSAVVVFRGGEYPVGRARST
jgi:hypothetical protein